MSFTKEVFNNINASIEEIRMQTLDSQDLTIFLEMLDTLLDAKESFVQEDAELGFFWNEIVSDSIAILHSGMSGNYRLAIAGLRNLLEISCHAFYYLDHKIEFKLFVNENGKSDKYVSTLINDHLFFTTKYIKTFFPDIQKIQHGDNTVSNYLSLTYQKLCDVVHGRYDSLTKKDDLRIAYSRPMFEKFKASFRYTIGAVLCMHMLRFNHFSNITANKIVGELNIIKI